MATIPPQAAVTGMLTRRSLLAGMGAAPPSRGPGETRLLLDSRVVARSEGLRLALGTVVKEPRNPLLANDKPWEPYPGNQYTSILFDEEARVFKCWYNIFVYDEQHAVTPKEKRVYPYRPTRREQGVCYAVSRDGIRWEKPELGLIEFEGSKKNNLVARDTWEVGVFRDPHDIDAARRYKMFFKIKDGPMAAKFSSDGLRWSQAAGFPGIDARGDTHNNAFWAPDLNRYVGITRLWNGKERTVGRTESPDFREWTKAAEIMKALPGEAPRQTYAMPVFRYANVYLGLVMMFNAGGRKTLATEANAVDCELAWSPDTVQWERICPGVPFIPRGPQGGCDGGCVYAAAYPFLHQGKILLYYAGSNKTHNDWREDFLCLARLRPDGFAGWETTGPAPGSVITRRVRSEGSRICVSADAKGGSVRAALPGLGWSRPISGEVTRQALDWPGAPRFEGRDIELHFELRSAKLYSFTLCA